MARGKRNSTKPTEPSTKAPLAPKGPTVLEGIRIGDLQEVEHEETWNAMVEEICTRLQLPSLTSRKGLKEIHKNYTQIREQLDHIFNSPATPKRMKAGVVAIWGKMCADAKLRDALCDDGLLGNLVPLLDDDEICQLALHAISAVTHHGCQEPRAIVALQTPALLEVMKRRHDNGKIMELVTAIMCHAIPVVIFVETPPSAKDLRRIDLIGALRATTQNLKKPIASEYMANHALGLLTSATRDCYDECQRVPAVASFLVACLRASDVTVRTLALGGIVRLFERQGEEDIPFQDPRQMMAATTQQWPANLKRIVEDYGAERCDTVIKLRVEAEYQDAMAQVVRDSDLAGLGRKLALFILRTEYAISEGYFQGNNGLPFRIWTDALPQCARVLRDSGQPSDLDMADILHIKFYILRQRVPGVLEAAESAIARNPGLAYAHYAISLGPDSARGLRAAKVGLKCKGLTPFIRNYMLWRAADHAANKGLALLEVGAWNADKVESTAFLDSALEDTKKFLAQAPPDNRHMHTMLNWYMILRVVLDGPKLSKDLREINEVVRKAKVSEQLSNFLSGVPPKNTQGRMIRELILKLYADAAEEWKDVIRRFDHWGLPEHKLEHSRLRRAKADDNIEDWLANIEEDDDAHEPATMHNGQKKPQTTTVELYRCSWCGNPSAVLRKCGGCSKTRYCDAACQKADWKQHKATCKAAVAA